MAIGGARPGAGRKKKTTVEAQATRRDVVLSVFSVDRLRTIVEHDVAAAERGDTARIDRWLSYVLGSPKQEIEHSGGVFSVEVKARDYREALGAFLPPAEDEDTGTG